MKWDEIITIDGTVPWVKAIHNKDNGVYLGDFMQKEDGFFDWYPKPLDGGYWPSYILRAFTDCLDELNEPYQKELEEYFARID